MKGVGDRLRSEVQSYVMITQILGGRQLSARRAGCRGCQASHRYRDYGAAYDGEGSDRM